MYNKKENRDYEIELIKLVIYYMVSTITNIKKIEEAKEVYNLFNAHKILKEELKIESIDETIFYFEQPEDNIINRLANRFKSIDLERYKEIVQNVRLKLGEANSVIKYRYKICTLSSEEDVNAFANEIYYFNQSIEELKEEANDNMYAKFELGYRYYNIDENEKAYNLFNQAANEENKNAMYYKICALYDGKGIQKDEKKAFEELSKLIKETKIIEALTLLGKMYYEGRGVEKNYQKAFECFNESCYYDSEATYYIGIMYLHGQGIEKDEWVAKYYLQKARTKKSVKELVELLNKEKRKEIDFSVDFIDRHGLLDTYDKELKNNNSSIIENIVEAVVGDISKMPIGTEATLFEIICKYKKLDRNDDIKFLFELTEKINEKCKEKNIILDYSKYKGKKVGLPFNVYFVRK